MERGVVNSSERTGSIGVWQTSGMLGPDIYVNQKYMLTRKLFHSFLLYNSTENREKSQVSPVSTVLGFNQRNGPIGIM
jgi:hypothetical protein